MIYRLSALVVAAVHILVFHDIRYPLLSPVALLALVAAWTGTVLVARFPRRSRGALHYGMLGVDAAVCAFVVLSTHGLRSPFILYSLVPIVSSALFFDGKTTLAVAAASGAYVISSDVFGIFDPSPLSVPMLSYFFVYAAAVSLIAVLPYLMNAYLRERIRYDDVLSERQRLSREVHDGMAQTLSALRWQTQVLRRRLAAMGIDLEEARELEVLAEKARYESREALELLRNYTGDGSLLPHLKDYLEHLSRDNHIDFQLEATDQALKLDAAVELELLRICQEAMNNVRLHAGATQIRAAVERADGMVRVTIGDNGRGFDAVAFYHGGNGFTGHGLTVMHERAQSVGGRCRVFSMPGHGAEVRIEVPTGHHSLPKHAKEPEEWAV